MKSRNYLSLAVNLNGKKKIKAKICSSLFSKFIGMMFRTSNTEPLIFVFSKEQRIKLHMFFVFFPIYAVWLDKKKRKVAMRKLKPFSVSPAFKAKYVLEIPVKE